MKSSVLKPAIWLTNFILISLGTSLIMLLSLYSYYGYSINAVIQLEFLNIDVIGDADRWLINTKIILLTVGHVISLYIFWNVRQVLKNIVQEGPFEPVIIGKLKTIFSSIILLGVFKMATTFILDVYQGELKIVISTATIVIVFLISIVYLLIEIFKHGVMIREEQRMTI